MIPSNYGRATGFHREPEYTTRLTEKGAILTPSQLLRTALRVDAPIILHLKHS